MVVVHFEPRFEKRIRKINDQGLKEQLKKQIAKIVANPEIGKPMRFSRTGTRELYIGAFRLSYLLTGDTITFLDLYHKDEQ